MRERDDDSGDAPAPTSHAPPDRESNESAVPLLAPAVGTWSPTASVTNPLKGLPEEWQALGRKFDFTYTNIVCLMSTTPGHTRDETSLAVLATALESALDSKDWNRTQSLLCVLLCSDPVYTVDATIIIRLTSLAVRAALASDESDYQADFTSRLGKALVEPLAALVRLLSALESGSPTEGCGGDGGDGGGDGGGGAPATEYDGGDASGYGCQVPADVRTRSSGNHRPRLPPPAGVQKRSSGNRKRAAMEPDCAGQDETACLRCGHVA